MKRFNVLLDSNIFIGAKYNFAGGSLNNLKKYCENGTAVLFSNDIIIREVQSHIDNDIVTISKQAKNAIKSRREIINAISQEAYDHIEATIMSSSKLLHSKFSSYMNDAIILDNDKVSITNLFNNYFEKIAPFEEKKKSEFPDAVVVMSIKQYLSQNPNVELHIVTDDDGWQHALSEIEGAYLYNNLNQLLRKISETETAISTKINQFVITCIPKLESTTEDWFSCQDWSYYIDNIDMCIECDDLVDLYIKSMNLRPEGIEYIDIDGEFASVMFSGSAILYLGFDYIDHTYETYDREDHTYYNTIYGKGAAELKVSFTGTIVVLFPENDSMELNSSELEEINLGNVEITDYELTPYRNDNDSYFSVCPDCGQPIGIRNDGGNGFCDFCSANH